MKRIKMSQFLITTLFILSGVFGFTSCSRTEKPTPVVNLAIWPNYISKETIQEFEKTTGSHVQMTNFSSNEELLAKLQGGATGYDVILPADYMVFVLQKLGLVEPLDYSQIPNSQLLDPKFLKRYYDLKNTVSLPLDWGTTGFAVNRSLYKGSLRGWKDLLTQKDLDGKFSLLDDMREVIGAALKALGYSLNSKNPDELQKAKELLLGARKRVKAFTSEPIMALVNKDVAVAHAFMTDALLARQRGGESIDFVLPSEGGVLWVDNLCIPKGAQHIKEAHALINYLLEPKVNADRAMGIFVAPLSLRALSLLPQ